MTLLSNKEELPFLLQSLSITYIVKNAKIESKRTSLNYSARPLKTK